MKMRSFLLAFTLIALQWAWTGNIETIAATPLYPSLPNQQHPNEPQPVEQSTLRVPAPIYNQQIEQFYVDPQMASACKMEVMQKNILHFVSTGRKVASALNALKEEPELDAYFQMHLKPELGPTKWNDYRNKYKNIIRKAAEIFGIPTALHACNLFRESYFRPEIVNATAASKCQGAQTKTKNSDGKKLKKCTSTTGAIGIGQFQPSIPPTKNRMGISGTIEAIDKILKRRTRGCTAGNDRTVDACEQKEADRLWDEVISPHRSQARRSRNFVVSANYSNAVLAWNEYQLRKYWRKYFNSVNEKIPNGFDKTSAANYKIAIPASAMWLKYSMLELDSAMAEKGKPSLSYSPQGETIIDFFAVLSGLYNRGNGQIKTRLMSCSPSSPQCWKKELAGRRETAKHMDGVLQCMQAGNICTPEVGNRIEGCQKKIYIDKDPKITKRYLDKKAREAQGKGGKEPASTKKPPAKKKGKK